MGTIVSLHAHPDDECIMTGGTIARAAAEGHRVVVVIATNGDHGESPDDLADGETLVDRRRIEAERSAAILGAQRLAWLGFVDSGMTGWDQNEHPEAFVRADLDAAAELLAVILREEQADVLLTYDWHGNYGHPDHIKVHHVGYRAAELAGTPRVWEATMNRDAITRWMERLRLADPAAEVFDPSDPADDGNPMGEPESAIAWCVDVTGYVDVKRRSIQAHASQVTDSSSFLSMPEDEFAEAFGTEWYCERGHAGPPKPGWPLP